ncbi:1, 4-beta cellobiohydrolase [Coprinopsis sp. MPI-PUGE-AT-0042]|nr:1, 4-beta cellobiohydrolase [Coprinopsis sp. MPI-PUGE-AT-0042]
MDRHQADGARLAVLNVDFVDNERGGEGVLAETLHHQNSRTPGVGSREGVSRDENNRPKVRGLATSVSNYNQYITSLRENLTIGNNAWDEWHFVNRLAPHLEKAGYPAHFIVDQGRAGRAGIRTEWSQWCNVRNAGYGIRPTTDQGVLNNTYVDAIVWVKRPGEFDGASPADVDKDCNSPVAHVPAPEAGEWFNAYAVNLVLNANPPLDPTV